MNWSNLIEVLKMALKYAKQTELHFSIGSFIAFQNICIKYRIHAESDFVVVVMKGSNEFDWET